MSVTLDESGPKTEVLKYALQMHGMDFGVMNARNQFVGKVINPLMDSVMDKLKQDHVTNSGTVYTVKLIIESERQVEIQ